MRRLLRSFRDALRGIAFVAASQRNARIHAAMTLAVCALGWTLRVDAHDWRWLVLAIGGVWVAEALNTAVELLGDSVSEERHPLVGRAKDAAAGGVLVAAVAAAIIGLLVFVPRVVHLLR